MPISNQQKKSAVKKLTVTPPPIKGRGIPPGNAKVSKAEVLDRMLENKVVRYVNNEVIDESGNIITGVASYTKAQTADVGFDTSERHLLMSDVPVDSYGGKALFLYSPTRTTQKLVQQKPWVYQSTFSNLLTNFPAASWPGQIARCGDVPGLLISNGTRYVPLLGQQMLKNVVYAGTLASPTKTTGFNQSSFIFDVGSPSFPAGLFDDGDYLEVKALYRGNGGSAYTPAMFLGTAGDATDPGIYANTTNAADDQDVEVVGRVYINTDTSFISSISNFVTTTGGGTNSLRLRNTQFNVASALKLTIGVGSMTNSGTSSVDLFAWSVNWVAKQL